MTMGSGSERFSGGQLRRSLEISMRRGKQYREMVEVQRDDGWLNLTSDTDDELPVG